MTDLDRKSDEQKYFVDGGVTKSPDSDNYKMWDGRHIMTDHYIRRNKEIEVEQRVLLLIILGATMFPFALRFLFKVLGL